MKLNTRLTSVLLPVQVIHSAKLSKIALITEKVELLLELVSTMPLPSPSIKQLQNEAITVGPLLNSIVRKTITQSKNKLSDLERHLISAITFTS